MTDETTQPIEQEEVQPTPREQAIQAGLEAANEQNGEDAKIVECPTCHNERRQFLIIDGKCDSCRTKGQQSIFPAVQLGWPEVRQRRDQILARTDWSQVEDAPAKDKAKFRDIRERLRDVTKESDPFQAWYKLDELEAATAK